MASAIGKRRSSAREEGSALYQKRRKEIGLFDEILREVVGRTAAIARNAESGPGDARSKLRELIVGLMTAYAESYPLMYIYVRENLSQLGSGKAAWSRQMRRLNREIEDSVIATVEAGYADGSLRQVGPSRIVALGILGMLDWTHRWFHPTRSEESAGQIAQTYAEMVVSGLAAK